MAAVVEYLNLEVGKRKEERKGLQPIPYRRMRPTQKHRLALSPGILGTMYGYNDKGVQRYFDYAWADAIAYAGVTPDSDVRVYKHNWYVRKDA